MTMIDELIKSVTKRLDKFLLNKMLCISTFLDPRHKLLYQYADENVVIEWVEEAWKEMQGAQDVIDSDSDDVPIAKAPASTGFFTIDNCFKDVAFMRTGRKQSEKRSEAERELIDIEVADIIKKQTMLRSAITQEIDNYLSLPPLENTGCPFCGGVNVECNVKN